VQEKKEGTKSHTFVLVESVEKIIGMNNFAKEAKINNREIAC